MTDTCRAALERLLRNPPPLHEEAPGRLTTWAIGDPVLRWCADRLGSGTATLETGAGISTLVFAIYGTRHTCVTPEQGEVDRIRAYAAEHGIGLASVSFVVAPSEQALPGLAASPLDLVLIDGSHSMPTTFLDWYYAARRLRPGGLAVIDNTELFTGRLLRDFLDEEPEWQREATFPVAAAFRLAAPFRDKGWWEQPYVVRRSDLTLLAPYSDLATFQGVPRTRLFFALLRRGKLRAAARWAPLPAALRPAGLRSLTRHLPWRRGDRRRDATSDTPSADGDLELRLARSEAYDRELEVLAERALPPEASCLDVGAHSGEVLARLRHACPGGLHVAFEPLPGLASALRTRFPDVEIHQVALAESPGETAFQWVVNDPAYSGLRRRAYDRPDPEIRTLRVRVERLDDLVPEGLPVGLIKIDVEGGELGVLRGARRTLERWRPFVVFEAGPSSTSYYGVGSAEIHDFLCAEHGFALSTMRRWLDGREPYDRDGFAAAFAGGEEFMFLAYAPEGPAGPAPLPGSPRLRRWKLHLAARGRSRLAETMLLVDRGRRRLRHDGWGAFLQRAVCIHRWLPQIYHARSAAPVPARGESGGVLVIDWTVPARDHNAGALRLRRIIDILLRLGLAVDVLPHDTAAPEPATAELRALGVGVVAGNFRAVDYLRATAASYDMCWINYADLAEHYVPLLQACAPRLQVVFDTVDLHFVRAHRHAAFGGRAEAVDRYRNLELDLVRRTAATVVVSEEERQVLLGEMPDATVHVVPTIHTPRRHRSGDGLEPAQRRGLLFVGSFPYAANGDAALWFVKQVLPRVRAELGTVPVHLVGPQPPRRVRRLASRRSQVHVPGWVADLEPLYDTCRMAIAPLRWGAGMKGKVGEAMAHGLPVVTTSVGAEGLGLTDGEQALIADGPEAFAAAIVRLHGDEALWRRLAAAGLEHVERRFSPSAVEDRVAALVRSLRPDGDPTDAAAPGASVADG